MNDNTSSNFPSKLGKWKIKRRLASREDKIVLLGENNDEFVAIKILKNADLLEDRERRRFDQEVINLKKLNHPHIPKIVDLDLVDAMQPWIATEFISGPTIQERVSKKDPLKLDEWLKALKEITSALAYVHSIGVYHRDISPSNIILSDSGAKLIDFGMSYVENTQTYSKSAMNVQGTPATLSPESLSFKKDSKMDMFSLGSTFIFAGSRHYPFSQEDNNETNWMQSILYNAPNFHNLNHDQIRLLQPLLYKDLADRISSSSYLDILEQIQIHNDILLTKTPKLEYHLKNAEQKLTRGNLGAVKLKTKWEKRFQILLFAGFGLPLVLLALDQLSLIEIDFISVLLLFGLGLIPVCAIVLGFVSFFKGLGKKKWGKKRVLASLGLTAIGILAPYLTTLIVTVSSIATFSFQSLIQDAFGQDSVIQVPSTGQTEIVPSIRKPDQENLVSPSPQGGLESKQQNTKTSQSSGFTSNDCEELFLANSKDALSACEAASAKNDDRSTYYLAAIYDKNGQKKQAETNYLKAISLYKDDTKSMLGLVQIYLDRNDLKNYQIWVEKCANYQIKTTSGARCKLLFGIDKIDLGQTKAGIAYLSDSFDWGNVSAGTYLAKYYETQKDFSKALSWYEKAAEKGDPMASNGLIALSYDQGNFEVWKKWITKSASEGKATDIGKLAIYLTISEKNYEEGKKWGLIGGKAGDATSMFAAGYSYYKGDKNLAEAKTWLLKSANLNNLLAARVLGEIYRSEKNSIEALFWYKKAAAGDDLSSTYQLAMIYLNDLNDLKEACSFFRSTITLSEKLKKSGDFVSSRDQKFVDNSTTGIATFCS